MLDNVTLAPGQPVSVTIAGVAYTLKFSILAEYEADALGVDVRQFLGGLRDASVGTLSNFMKLFSAMVAHHFVALKQPAPTPAQWAAAIDAEPTGKLREVCDAVGKCLISKMQASSAVRLQEATPAQGPQPN